MANLERVYTIPLGHIYKESRSKRARIAIRDLKAYARRHMKASKVYIGMALNEFIMRDSMNTPPRSVKVNAIKDEAGVVRLDLFGAEAKKPEHEAKPRPAKKPESAKKEEAEKPKEEKALSEAEKQARKEALKADIKK